jgi:hypothetical protein
VDIQHEEYHSAAVTRRGNNGRRENKKKRGQPYHCKHTREVILFEWKQKVRREREREREREQLSRCKQISVDIILEYKQCSENGRLELLNKT